MIQFNYDKTARFLFGAVLIFLFFSFTTTSFAQTTTDKQSSSNLSASIKVAGISPAVGISYQLSANSKFRGLGFFTINTSSSTADQYLLDFSYIRNFENSKAFDPYWGLNVNLQFNDLVVGPGLLLGSSYNLSENFRVFGEAGLNVYFLDNSDTAIINLFNSGVGISVSL